MIHELKNVLSVPMATLGAPSWTHVVVHVSFVKWVVQSWQRHLHQKLDDDTVPLAEALTVNTVAWYFGTCHE
jgi:hypothetical protein